MTVKQLIEQLQKLPSNDYITICNDINWISKDNPDDLKLVKYTWTHSNYPYDKPDFEYWNLE